MQYTYKEEDSIGESLLCPICTSPFVDPVDHLDCRNIFCKKCVENIKDCPLCRKPITNTIPPPKAFVGQLDKLKVSKQINIIILTTIKVICPSCKEIYTRGVLLDH